MALNKLPFGSFNVTAAASTAIKFNSDADGFETASAGGSLVKIASSTASSSASVSFTSGIDSTYKEYIFILNNIHPATDGASLPGERGWESPCGQVHVQNEDKIYDDDIRKKV